MLHLILVVTLWMIALMDLMKRIVIFWSFQVITGQESQPHKLNVLRFKLKVIGGKPFPHPICGFISETLNLYSEH